MTYQIWDGSWKGASPNGLQHTRAREIVRSTGTIVRGKFPSRKTGRMIHHEGSLERDAIYLFETMPQIESYTEQHETIIYPDGNRVRRYTPDFQLKLVSGKKILVEVKPQVHADKPETRHKLEQIATHLKSVRKEFVVLTDTYIRVEPRLSNLKWIYHQAPRRMMTELAADRAVNRVGHLFPMSLRDAIELLEPCGQNPFGLIIQGLLQCDLTGTLSLESPVHLRKEGRHGQLFI